MCRSSGVGLIIVRFIVRLLGLAGAFGLGLGAVAGVARATTINVSAACTVVEAITSFNDDAFTPGTPPQPGCSFVDDGRLTRTVAVPAGTFVFSTVTVAVTMTIVGAGVGQTALATTGPNGIVLVGSVRPNPTLTLRTLTLRKAVNITTATTGVLVNGLPGPAHLQLDRVRVADYTRQGLVLQGPSEAFFDLDAGIYDSTIENNALAGIEATDAGVSVSGSVINNNAGGGVRATFSNEFHKVAILSSTISNNRAAQGGGIFLADPFGLLPERLLVVGSTISDNQATAGGGGGVLVSDGAVRFERAVVDDNTATGDGGGILVAGVTLESRIAMEDTAVTNNEGLAGGGLAMVEGTDVFANIERSLFANNVAGGDGGGVYSGGQLSEFQNNTLHGNRGVRGGGLFHVGAGEIHVINCTVSGNTATTRSSGIEMSLSGTIFRENIVALNVAPSSPDIFVNPDASGFAFNNLIGNNAGATASFINGVDGNIVGVNPLLGGLQNLGGPTAVLPLLAGSPAIDASPVPQLPVDQRGVRRPIGSAADLGAFEGSCGASGQQLVSNQGFESGTTGWVGSFGTTITSSTAQAHSGARSLRIANRNLGTWQGAETNLLGLASPGDVLQATLWARVEGDPSEPVLFTMRSTCQGAATTFTTVASATATNTAWVQLSGSVQVPSCTLTELVVYAEGPRIGIVFYIDDVSVTRQSASCGPPAPAVSASGAFIVTTDWGAGYCVELRVTNHASAPTVDWSATFSLKGTEIYNIWNLDSITTVGIVIASPSAAWSQVIPAGGTSHSLGFCANRTSGGNALPSTPVVTADY
jgi:predicted outer membrane repeat protein